MKNLLKKIVYKNTYNSDAYVNYLRKNGCIVGDNTYFFAPRETHMDKEYLHFITIGNNCKITCGVTILAHDYSYSVLRPLYHDIPKKAALTKIGDNVFIGINSIILMGSNIGNNVIIGAGSVVKGKIPDNEVWGGNPAKFICTIDEYYKKCSKHFEEGAYLTVKQYNERFNRNPSIQELEYFSTLFLNNSENARENYIKMRFNGDKKNEVLDDCMNLKSKYKDYSELIEHCKKWEDK